MASNVPNVSQELQVQAAQASDGQHDDVHVAAAQAVYENSHHRTTSQSGCGRFCSTWCTWNTWKCILLGQVLSALICGTAITSQMLHSDYQVFAPTGQSFLNYVLLCLFYTSILSCRPGDKGLLAILRKRGWKYVLIAACDVEANYLMVKAYHYTTLTSVQLLDCFTIPVVLLLSWLALKVRYRIIHILGVMVCLLGVGCLVWADILGGRQQGEGPNRLMGDMLCLAAAVLYGISNVAEEFVVKNMNRVEFLGMLGLFGSVINGIQLSILEREEVATIPWSNPMVVMLLVTFAVCLFLFYSIMPVVIKKTSAAAVNLSILSADFYTLLCGLFLFGFKFHYLYFVAFGLILAGVAIYSMKETASAVHYSTTQNYRVMEDEPQIEVELNNHTDAASQSQQAA